jgi:hypothetical protein
MTPPCEPERCAVCGEPYQRLDAHTRQVMAPTASWRSVPYVLEWYECGGTAPACVPRLTARRGTLPALPLFEEEA